MKLVNETNQDVYYEIQNAGGSDCGTIKVDGLVDLPQFDNQQNVDVKFWATGREWFSIDCGNTKSDEAVTVNVSID